MRYSEDNTQILEKTTSLYPPSWWFGERDGCYIGVYCNKATSVDTSRRSDAKSQVKFDISPISYSYFSMSAVSLSQQYL